MTSDILAYRIAQEGCIKATNGGREAAKGELGTSNPNLMVDLGDASRARTDKEEGIDVTRFEKEEKALRTYEW